MIYISKKKFLINCFFIILIITAFIINNAKAVIETSGEFIKTKKIIIDAGHGLPDGGAVSENGIEEASLNLQIANKLRIILEENNYTVLMTRTSENNIADSDKQNSIKQIKTSDLNNRVKIANESDADFMISIHLNKYGESKYWGWQTFYNKNSKIGKELATLIQNSISKNIPERDNKRTPLSIEGIKIVDKTKIPVVIVECGFLSNEEDLKLLQTNEFQKRIAEGIFLRDRRVLLKVFS